MEYSHSAQLTSDEKTFKRGKTGVHPGVIGDCFSGKTEELAPKDREKIELCSRRKPKSADACRRHSGGREQ